MTADELNQIVNALKDCNDYLDGRVHSAALQQIAKQGAEQAVTQHYKLLLTQLKDAGLNLEGL